MIPTTRKRKCSPLDSDSHPAKRSIREEISSLKRRSPRKKLGDKSPQKSSRGPADSPARSPRKSPLKATVMTSYFYGKQKTLYLTPLERKVIKQCLPSPPSAPPSSSPLVKKPKKKTKKKANNPGKKCVGSSKGRKMEVKNYTRSTKLPKLTSSVTAKPPPPTTAPVGSKPVESKNTTTFIFSSLKPKPKIFVGAAFFCTGKKQTSIFKKFATTSSSKPAKKKTVVPQARKERGQQGPQGTNQQQEEPVQEVNQQGPKQGVKFDPTDWDDSSDKEPQTPQPISSPQVLKTFGITQDLKIVLSRTPSPGSSTSPSCLSVSEDTLDTAASSPPKDTAAMYPIFGSASKRLKNAALKTPLSCSTPSGSAASLPAPATAERSVRRRKEKQSSDQLIIDAGQKQFGATTCSSCGMVYSADNPEDHFQHTQFHQRFLNSIRFVGWKKERVVAEFWDGKILLVLPDDPKYAVKKADDVRRVADNELGFQQGVLSRPTQAKTYLFINTEQLVVGCLVAEPIRQANRVLEQPDQCKDMRKDDFMERHRAWCCSIVPETALCGISRIWVFSLARRQGIATRMLDTVRSTFMFGSHLTKEEIAFSDPTPDGKLFATKYSNTPTFLVYNFIA